MQSDPDTLAQYLRDHARCLGNSEQFWLGIAGAPGSGKSTMSAALLERLGPLAIVIPMDGYHYYRRELDRMSDPEEAHRRRGAPFTFNAEKFVRDVAAARLSGRGLFPSFDHGVGDPVEGEICLTPGHKVVIVEGNYVLLDDPPWSQLRREFDESWFLDVDVEVCKERVRKRFVETGRDEQTARFRVTYNDGPNAELVARISPQNADRILRPL